MLKPPRKVEDVKEAVCWLASKGDQEDEDDAVASAEEDGRPNTIQECVGKRGSDASVKEQDRDLDQSRTKHIVDLYCHRDLRR